MRPLVYTRYRAALLIAVIFLALAYLLMLRPDILPSQSLIPGAFGFAFVAWAYAFSLRCPKCHTNLMLTNKVRMQSGKRHDCINCGADLRIT